MAFDGKVEDEVTKLIGRPRRKYKRLPMPSKG